MVRILIATFLLVSGSSLSQKPLKEFYLKRSLKQEGQQFQFTVLDEDKRGVWFYNKKKFYFWYKSQKVLSTQGESSGALLDGEFEAFFENKQLSQKGKFKRGLKQGEWKYWRQDGTLRFTEKWNRGDLHEQNWHNDQGERIKTIVTKGNTITRESGDSTIIERKGGKYKEVWVRDSKGQLISYEPYRNGVYHGKVKRLNLESGSIDSNSYKDGKLQEKKEKTKPEKESDSAKKLRRTKKEKKERKPLFKRKKKKENDQGEQ